MYVAIIGKLTSCVHCLCDLDKEREAFGQKKIKNADSPYYVSIIKHL
jgi:hypothetical protein